MSTTLTPTDTNRSSHGLNWALPRSVVRAVLRTIAGQWPLIPGYSRLTRSRLVRWAYPTLTTIRRVRLRNNVTLDVDIADYNGRMLDLFGQPDPRVIRLCREFLRPGDIFLDIGANRGAVGLLCHDRVLPAGEVHMIEPQPELGRATSDAVKRNSLQHICIHTVGLHDHDGEITLSWPAGHTGKASVIDGGKGYEVATIPIRHCESFVREHAKGRPFAAKVDVEGIEDTIIPGLLAAGQPRFLLFECNQIDKWPAIHNKLVQAEYTAFGISRSVRSVMLQRLDGAQPQHRFEDYLAIPSEWLDQFNSRISLRQLMRTICRHHVSE